MSVQDFKEKLIAMIDSYVGRIYKINEEYGLMEFTELEAAIIALESDVERKIDKEFEHRTKGQPASSGSHEKIMMKILREKSLDYVQDKFQPLLKEIQAEAEESKHIGNRAPNDKIQRG